MGTPLDHKVADALEAWRAAERESVRSTARREAASEAYEAAGLAAEAARATSAAATAAVLAANHASRAASVTAAAAEKVLRATRMEADARHVIEEEAMAAEDQARTAHRDAVDAAAR